MLDKLIQNESTNHLFDSWCEYRNEITEYIKESIEHYLIKNNLIINKTLRYKEDINLDKLIANYETINGRKPVLAIWGAGGCNDIDIKELSKYAKLVLIDRDIWRIKEARDKYGLSNDECACIDLEFFKVTDDQYRMFDALLSDDADEEYVRFFLNEIVNSNVEIRLNVKFDFSVAVGLASQMVSRFVAISTLHGIYKYNNLFMEISNYAVNSLYNSVRLHTSNVMIWGYETNASDANGRYSLHNRKDMIDDFFSEFIHTPNSDFEELPVSEVEGNNTLIQLLTEDLKMDCSILTQKSFVWPFTEDKYYLLNCLAIV